MSSSHFRLYLTLISSHFRLYLTLISSHLIAYECPWTRQSSPILELGPPGAWDDLLKRRTPHMTNPCHDEPHMTNHTPLAVPNGSVLLQLYKARHAPLRTTTSCPRGWRLVSFGAVRIAGWALARSPVSRPISGIPASRGSISYLVSDTGVYHRHLLHCGCAVCAVGTWRCGPPLVSMDGLRMPNRADIVPWCTDLAFSDGPHTRSSREPASVRCGSGARTGPSPT